MKIPLNPPDQRDALNTSEIRALELEIAERSCPLDELMRRAGSALAQFVEANTPQSNAVAILCGSGNNAGDGWVAARVLAHAGRSVHLISPREAADIKAEPAASEAAATILTIEADALDVRILVNPQAPELDEVLASCPVVIDAMLGTGFSGTEVKEPYRTWIERANVQHARAGRCHIACDIPSGMAADTGSVAAPTFAADATITMIVPKLAFAEHAAKDYLGEVFVADIEHAQTL